MITTYTRADGREATYTRESVWDDREIVLRDLWAEGHSIAEIGRRMGMTKNSIVGKAHRLDLPGRPSPIVTTGERSHYPRPVRVRGPTLPPLASALEARPVPPPPAARPNTARETQRRATLASAVARSPVVVTTLPCMVQQPLEGDEGPDFVSDVSPIPVLVRGAFARAAYRAISSPMPIDFRAPHPRPASAPRHGRVIDCQWLEGDGPFVGCMERSEPGISWCKEHANRCLVRVRDRREDAA